MRLQFSLSSGVGMWLEFRSEMTFLRPKSVHVNPSHSLLPQIKPGGGNFSPLGQ